MKSPWIMDASELTAKVATQNARIRELETILQRFAPAAFDILWCALVWNDHNFSHDEFFKKATRAAKALGFDRGLGRGVDQANEFMERIDRALGDCIATLDGEGK